MLKIASMIPDEDPVEIGNLELNFYSDRVFPEAMAQEVQTGACNATLQCEFSSADNLQFKYDLRHVSSKLLQFPDTIALRDLFLILCFPKIYIFHFAAIICTIAALISLIFCHNGGNYVFTIFDNFR